MALLDNLLAEITPEQQARTDRKMRIACIIDDAMKAKGLGKKQFADKVGRKPSEITKWLSGTHNFTVETLADIERVLGVRILNLNSRTKSKHNISGNVSVNL
ncbi:MAG: helix-turn-helix domain-containing protein [Arcicella sp.]|jgi:transcriptional regulator with XRE-family HTH domain|nr:helix-turn-helix domain-containing protein [Arcicella sp.]